MTTNNSSNLSYTAAKGSSPGGSATVNITDARINGNSIVGGNIETSGNAVHILRVAPSMDGITFYLSGDPGASTFTYWAFNLFRA